MAAVAHIWPFPLSSTMTSGKALVWGSVLSYSQWGCFVEMGLVRAERACVEEHESVKILRNIG